MLFPLSMARMFCKHLGSLLTTLELDNINPPLLHQLPITTLEDLVLWEVDRVEEEELLLLTAAVEEDIVGVELDKD
jgi:hypothetical protein